MKHTVYFNLLEALNWGCPVCILSAKAVKKFMDDFLYQGINDTGLREEIRKGWGFCTFHSWQLRDLGDGFGQAIIYDDLIGRICNELEKLLIHRKFSKVSEISYSKNKCIFCKVKENAEKRYLSAFWESFSVLEFKLEFEKSQGLCFLHLLEVIKIGKSKKQIQELIDIEKVKLHNLLQELKEFIKKHDYRFASEEFGEEKDVWIRAVRKIAGERGF